ncbi:MAG: 5-formyltetrahydrofolate cyclo-ligase [Desulfurococcales archaeon]|nr:5-formyltetrahydrofolate cyclo-ligase [Desulfurococcales archaeon]
MTISDIKRVKNEIRKRIWDILERENIARFPRPVYGRIPNFVGAEEAANRLFRTSLWRKAKVIKVNPDSPQKPVRLKALLDGKIVIMASPRLKRGFILLDPRTIPAFSYRYASTIRGAFVYGREISLQGLPMIDLVVTGSVAIDKQGNRLGKGGGYAELEYAILRELGLVNEYTPIVTTIHDKQLVNEIPWEPHDLVIDAAFTPTKTLYFKASRTKPGGIIWDILGEKKELPVIRELARLKSITL